MPPVVVVMFVKNRQVSRLSARRRSIGLEGRTATRRDQRCSWRGSETKSRTRSWSMTTSMNAASPGKPSESSPTRAASSRDRVLGRRGTTRADGQTTEEFDPGSARTLAAWLKHASRTRKPLRGQVEWRKGEEYVPTYPQVGDSPGKPGLIPDVVPAVKRRDQRLRSPGEWGTSYQVVGEVTAHQAVDG